MCDLGPLIQADPGDRPETTPGGALASWVTVPTTGLTPEGARQPVLVAVEEAAAVAVVPGPKLSLIGAMPVASWFHMAAPLHDRR